MTWWISDRKTYKHAINGIPKQRDRGAGIMAAAILQDHLLLAIKSRLQRHPNVEASMFKQSGPLGSFAAQIDLGFLLGLYPEYVREKLHTIRLIRNEFAHNVQPVSFKSQRDSCLKLKPKRGAARGVTAAFDTITKSLDVKVRFDTFQSSTNPRAQYIRAVQQITMLLNISSEAAKRRSPSLLGPSGGPTTSGFDGRPSCRGRCVHPI